MEWAVGSGAFVTSSEVAKRSEVTLYREELGWNLIGSRYKIYSPGSQISLELTYQTYNKQINYLRWTVDGGRETGDGRRQSVDGGRSTVDGRRWTEDG